MPVSPITTASTMGPEMQPKVSDPASPGPTACHKDSASSKDLSNAQEVAGHSEDVSRSPSMQLQNPVNPHPRPRTLRRKRGLTVMNSNQKRNNLMREDAVVGSSEYYIRPLPSLPVSCPLTRTGEAGKVWRSTAEEQEVLEELADQFVVGTK
ncbi:hypothetical protein CGRA01v4_05889 [Colletotrichum graminicola]|nr:hypothetical protein CGRA01v4_05889 [Colletotrichum graminicola]